MLRLKGHARTIVKELQPDLVHCLRIPIAGFIGALIGYHPLVVSSWGSDLVTFARKYWFYRWLTRKTMRRADAYIPDTIRDLYIAAIYGFSPSKPSLILPVTGGLKLEEFAPYRMSKDRLSRGKIGVNLDINLLIMTRNFKTPFSNNEALVYAMPQSVKAFPDTLLIMVGNTRSPGYLQIRTLVEKLGMVEHVRQIHWLGYDDFVTHLAASDIMVSVGLSDGCPVSMLEGMVCGVIPAMSNDFPIQEWLTDGWNGYLFDPRDPESIAQAIIRALKNRDNFEMMRERNWDLLAEKADYHKNMKTVDELYRQVIEHDSARYR